MRTLEAGNYLDQKSRLVLSHRLRSQADKGGAVPRLDTYWFENFEKSSPSLPSPGQQATNIVAWIGDTVLSSGARVASVPLSFFASVGAPNQSFAVELANELARSGKLSVLGFQGESTSVVNGRLNLTLQGWETYEAEKRGQLHGDFGFIAMKFNDAVLDPFVLATVKPAVLDLGYRLVDMRDVAKPGLIDNIMRQTIRDASFVLVDLTHDNSGAYWEAGFAEGLGKPVLYICEQTKFDQKATHFDTNHCTTITWGGSKRSDQFTAELQATLRNELRLFAVA